MNLLEVIKPWGMEVYILSTVGISHSGHWRCIWDGMWYLPILVNDAYFFCSWAYLPLVLFFKVYQVVKHYNLEENKTKKKTFATMHYTGLFKYIVLKLISITSNVCTATGMNPQLNLYMCMVETWEDARNPCLFAAQQVQQTWNNQVLIEPQSTSSENDVNTTVGVYNVTNLADLKSICGFFKRLLHLAPSESTCKQ